MRARYHARLGTWTTLQGRIEKLHPATKEYMISCLQPLREELESRVFILSTHFGDDIDALQAPEEDCSSGDEGMVPAREFKKEHQA